MNTDICTVRGEEELEVQVIIKIVSRYSLSDILTIDEKYEKQIFLWRWFWAQTEFIYSNIFTN